MRSQKAMAVETVSGDVCSPLMISTPFCTGTGFMKCVLMTREALERSVGFPAVVEAAMRVIEIEEVFVARMAWGGQTLASEEKMVVLRSGISWRSL